MRLREITLIGVFLFAFSSTISEQRYVTVNGKFSY